MHSKTKLSDKRQFSYLMLEERKGIETPEAVFDALIDHRRWSAPRALFHRPKHKRGRKALPVAAAAILVALALCLTGCGDPNGKGTTTQTKTAGWVDIPHSNQQVWCMWWNWGNNSAAITCDWSRVRVPDNGLADTN